MQNDHEQATDEVIELCREFVGIPSESGQEGAMAARVQEEMQRLGFDRVWVDDLGNVIGLVRGTAGDGPVLLFDAHMDVVPATQPGSWRYPPFSATLEGGRIWGRGSSDMKGALAAMLIATARVDRSRIRGTIAISASVGEEMIEGVALAEVMRQIPPNFVIVGEPTGMRLGLAQKGRAGFCMRTGGIPAHTSRPQLGVNAVYRMLPLIERLRALPLADDPVLGQEIMEVIEIVSAPFPGNSIVPDGCRVRVDCRLVRSETAEQMLERLRDSLGLVDLPYPAELSFNPVVLHCYTGRDIHVPDYHPAWQQPENSAFAIAARRGLRSAGLPGEGWVVPYGTNASYSAGIAHVPTIICGPSTIDVAHGSNELIQVDELLHAVRGYQSIMQQVLA